MNLLKEKLFIVPKNKWFYTVSFPLEIIGYILLLICLPASLFFGAINKVLNKIEQE